MRAREIGPVGTAVRVIVGLGLLYLGGAVWDVSWYDPLVGFVALPGIMVAVGLLALRYANGPVHFTGVGGHAANCVLITALVVNPYTSGGALLFYGASTLVAAWYGQRGCELTMLSNLILRRDDQIGCPVFLPADEIEDRLRAKPAHGSS